jgi:hypothetical protein
MSKKNMNKIAEKPFKTLARFVTDPSVITGLLTGGVLGLSAYGIDQIASGVSGKKHGIPETVIINVPKEEENDEELEKYGSMGDAFKFSAGFVPGLWGAWQLAQKIHQMRQDDKYNEKLKQIKNKQKLLKDLKRESFREKEESGSLYKHSNIIDDLVGFVGDTYDLTKKTLSSAGAGMASLYGASIPIGFIGGYKLSEKINPEDIKKTNYSMGAPRIVFRQEEDEDEDEQQEKRSNYRMRYEDFLTIAMSGGIEKQGGGKIKAVKAALKWLGGLSKKLTRAGRAKATLAKHTIKDPDALKRLHEIAYSSAPGFFEKVFPWAATSVLAEYGPQVVGYDNGLFSGVYNNVANLFSGGGDKPGGNPGGNPDDKPDGKTLLNSFSEGWEEYKKDPLGDWKTYAVPAAAIPLTYLAYKQFAESPKTYQAIEPSFTVKKRKEEEEEDKKRKKEKRGGFQKQQLLFSKELKNILGEPRMKKNSRNFY